jgi:hypothetical protein
MPYLDSKIETNKHKNDCSNPVGKRLYIRDYNDKGKSCFVPWGLTCTTCGVVIQQENYQPNLTPSELNYVESSKKHSVQKDGKYAKLIESMTGRPYVDVESNLQEDLEWRRKRKVAKKLKRLQQKGQPPMTPRERSMRMKLYKFEGQRNYCLGLGRGYRPNELCEKFLSLNPRPTMKELYEALYPLKLDIYEFQKINRRRKIKIIPDLDPNRPHTPGRTNLKEDFSGWIPDPEKEGYIIPNPDPDPNFKSDWDKLIEEETRLRREVMKRVIESRGEKVPILKVLTKDFITS